MNIKTSNSTDKFTLKDFSCFILFTFLIEKVNSVV